MPKYTVIYEIVETYDATLEGDFGYYSLRDAIKNGHYAEDFDRSWRDGDIRVIDILEVQNV